MSSLLIDPTTLRTFRALASLPEAQHDAQGANLDGEVYVFGARLEGDHRRWLDRNGDQPCDRQLRSGDGAPRGHARAPSPTLAATVVGD